MQERKPFDLGFFILSKTMENKLDSTTKGERTRDHIFYDLLEDYKPNPIQVFQVGAIESFKEAWRIGSGWSDTIFGSYINEYGGKLTVCDINLDHLANSSFAGSCLGYNVDILYGDAINFIKDLSDQTIYYLDGSNDPEETLAQFNAIKTKSSTIIVDDFKIKGTSLPKHIFYGSEQIHDIVNGVAVVRDYNSNSRTDKIALKKSMSYIDGDPEIVSESSISECPILGTPNFACGQIKMDTDFGKKLNNLASDSRYKTFLEIGSWCGLGSTKCLLDGIILRDDAKLISLESNLKFYEITKRYWSKFFAVHGIDKTKLDLRYGTLVSYDELDEHYITDSGQTKETYGYNFDIQYAPKIILEEDIDVLCLDGGHFSTLLEWELFKERTKIVAIDDTSTSKTNMILKEIKESERWDIIYESDQRNGEIIVEAIG